MTHYLPILPLALSVAVAALLTAAAAAEDETVDPDRATLWTACRSVDVAVFVNDAAQSLGVADPLALETMAENRLQAARLLSPTFGDVRGGGLTIHVEVAEDDPVNVYSFAVEFVRVLINPFNAKGAVEFEPSLGLDRIATVTAREYARYIGWFGARADPAAHVRASISDGIDEFIRDYLRVNGTACEDQREPEQ